MNRAFVATIMLTVAMIWCGAILTALTDNPGFLALSVVAVATGALLGAVARNRGFAGYKRDSSGAHDAGRA